MLQIVIPISQEKWDEEKEEFIEPEYQTLQLEHSLIALSKWESKWHKSFLHEKELSEEEAIDYIRCMTLTKNIPSEIYDNITLSEINGVLDYIANPMTATTFSETKQPNPNREIVTAEVIYYWMTVHGIPFECEKWHLNRLITLIRVCSVKSQPSKKLSRSEIVSRNAALNATRRKHLNTKG